MADDRMRELVPEKLRELVRREPVVEACFATAAYGGLNRESALVQCVLELCKQLGGFRYEWQQRLDPSGLRRGPAPVATPSDAAARAIELIERADAGGGRQDIKLVADYLRQVAAAQKT